MNKTIIALCTLVSINAIACAAAPKADVKAAPAAIAEDASDLTDRHMPPPNSLEANRNFSCRWTVVQTGRTYDTKEDAQREGIKAAKKRGLTRIDVAETCRSEELVLRTASR